MLKSKASEHNCMVSLTYHSLCTDWGASLGRLATELCGCPEESAYREYQSALRKFNNQLKSLARSLQLSFPITSYTLRHSWATIAKYRGVPIEKISESLGHKSIKTTQIYLKGFELKELTEVNRMNLSYVNRCSVKI